ncbi:SusC/RagA family TonB-linked outer membrane protein [Ferruginibacter albus]|uniref:SusC/RagA family TonB-linked outer membrane protein n=1 Tax=Ferruginibacter albus TaxID=2875540 RepID=UPI001CC4702D|nr:TonB-dependent receptor [Ferruginibacter albus]UAY51936.1 TonB-dependent receptor [Ferruginibacter albus]
MRQKAITRFTSITMCFLCLIFSASVIAQVPAGTTITGTVLSNAGVPLHGATVIIKGGQQTATTDEKGAFSIAGSTKATLIVSYVGYISREISLEGKNNVEVRLNENPAELSNVVVIGYGTAKKSDLTGSVVSVKANELNAVPATSFDQALQGRAAGVQVTQMSGKPGAETSIRIRGTSSITAGNEPLYVIDGLLISSDGNDISNGNVTRGPRISALSSINPNDIESIEILKDASATAMYGSRGTNGVVLITTKRGKAGKGTLTFDTYQGQQQVANKLHLLNASQFADFVNDAKINAGQVPVYVNPKNLGTGTDWQNALFRNAYMGNYQLSFSGGDAKTKYAISGSLFKQDGIVISSDFKRYSLRANIESKVNDRITVGTNTNYSRIETNGVLTNDLGQIVPGVVTSALLFNPVLPVYDTSVVGGYTYENKDKFSYIGKTLGNPIAEAQNYISNTVLSRILSNTFAQYSFSKSLTFKTTFGIDAYTNEENSFGPNFLKRTQASNGEAALARTNGLTWLNENTLTYNKTFNQRHAINAVAGYTMQQFNDDYLVATAFDFPDNRTGYHNISAAQNPQKPVNGESQWSMISYLGRINYTLDSKYLFTVTGRVDGSSKFAENNKYGFFPSGAFAWRVSKEKFLQNINAITDLKFRTSYGVIGNQSIPPYQSLALVAPFGQGVFNTINGSDVYTGQEPISYVNTNLKWETTKQFDVGIDLSLLKNRISITADYYNKKTDDLLLPTPIPLTTGFATTLLNIGNIENHGFEFDVRTINLKGKVEWTSSFNLSLNRNTMTNLNNATDVILNGVLLLRQGLGIGTFYGYQTDGIFQTDAEAASSAVLVGQTAKAGDRKYKDLDGNGKIDGNDRTVLGSAQPDFTWGFGNTVSYKNLELSFFFQGSQGNKMANLNNLNLLNFTGTNNVLADAALNRWTPDNPSNKYPRALANAFDQSTISSALIEDASYVRLKSVTISYTLPEKAIKRIGMSNLKVYVSGTNLLTITNYTGYDPEANTAGQSTTVVGLDFGGYPQAKVFQVGLSATF